MSSGSAGKTICSPVLFLSGMTIRMRRTTLTVCLLLPLAACQWLNDMGSHMPVAGERCENWQCVTAEGQARSDAIRRAREQGAAPASQPQTAPAPSSSAPAAPAKPAPAAAPKGTTPYDTITPENMYHLPPV